LRQTELLELNVLGPSNADAEGNHELSDRIARVADSLSTKKA